MNRLQKKCIFASTGFHLLMLVILFVGPAFLASREKPEDSLPVLEIIPMITTDAMVEPTGGNPIATQPPPAPAPTPPAPERRVTPPKPTPPEPNETVRTPAPSLEPAKTRRELPKVSLTRVSRPSPTKPSASNPDSQAREDAKQRAEIKSALQSLRSSLSSSTKVEMGYGGGGPTYANFLQAVKSIYAKAWAGTVPTGATDETTFVKVSVTIARDGTVLSTRIERSSGKPLVDASVQSVLNRIKKAVPLPQDSKDNERTVEITFEVNPRNLAG